MKKNLLQLALVRHAKALRPESGQPDFERDLNDKGRRVAAAMGDFLAARTDFRPNVVLSSPAVRALATAQLVGAPLGFAIDRISQNENIYEATPGDLAAIVHGFAPAWTFVTMVGHNPGLSDFADWLLGDEPIGEMPTGAVAWLRFKARSWGEVLPGSAQLHHYWTPRELGFS